MTENQTLSCFYVNTLTWMSSSLELKSDTRTFCPSMTRVSDTHSRPEASVCALDGRSRYRPPRITFTMLNVGCKGPRLRFRASLATLMTSSQHFSTAMQRNTNGDLSNMTRNYKMNCNTDITQYFSSLVLISDFWSHNKPKVDQRLNLLSSSDLTWKWKNAVMQMISHRLPPLSLTKHVFDYALLALKTK